VKFKNYALESLLKEAFPFDVIEEVGKGVRGADCIQIVRNNFGQPCGKIIYESKRTQAFSNEWIEKLKIRYACAECRYCCYCYANDAERYGFIW
jgi:hypothetical protein